MGCKIAKLYSAWKSHVSHFPEKNDQRSHGSPQTSSHVQIGRHDFDQLVLYAQRARFHEKMLQQHLDCVDRLLVTYKQDDGCQNNTKDKETSNQPAEKHPAARLSVETSESILEHVLQTTSAAETAQASPTESFQETDGQAAIGADWELLRKTTHVNETVPIVGTKDLCSREPRLLLPYTSNMLKGSIDSSKVDESFSKKQHEISECPDATGELTLLKTELSLLSLDYLSLQKKSQMVSLVASVPLLVLLFTLLLASYSTLEAVASTLGQG